MKFLHELPDAQALFEVLARERQLLPSIIEKDYWVMHCLWGLQQQGFIFELKGGTSLSKGFGIIERFSEDLDILIHPYGNDEVPVGRNQDKPKHIKARVIFFDDIAKKLKIPGLEFSRDNNFDDLEKMRGAGIRGEYSSFFSNSPSLKPGVVLELGFDQTTPNVPCEITSWAYDKAQDLNLDIIDNRAKGVNCYCPEYTFVEKLQTISTKYRLQQSHKKMPINWHYYDVYQLLHNERVLNFIGSEDYLKHKEARFRSADEKDLKNNEAFTLPNTEVRFLYSEEFKKKSAIYFGRQADFETILSVIQKYINNL